MGVLDTFSVVGQSLDDAREGELPPDHLGGSTLCLGYLISSSPPVLCVAVKQSRAWLDSGCFLFQGQ